MRTLLYALATSVVATIALAPISQAAFAASSEPVLVQPSKKQVNLDGFVALYGVPAPVSDARPTLKSNGSNFPGAADLPDDSSLRLGSF